MKVGRFRLRRRRRRAINGRNTGACMRVHTLALTRTCDKVTRTPQACLLYDPCAHVRTITYAHVLKHADASMYTGIARAYA